MRGDDSTEVVAVSFTIRLAPESEALEEEEFGEAATVFIDALSASRLTKTACASSAALGRTQVAGKFLSLTSVFCRIVLLLYAAYFAKLPVERHISQA